MKQITATAFALVLHTVLFAQSGYEIKVTLKPFKNQYIYLGHYYGRQLPIIDSVKLNEKSEGVFRGTKKLGGGIYLIGYPDRAHNFEILIDKNQRFAVIADTASIQKVSFVNAPENVAFKAYQDFMNTNGRALDALYTKRKGTSGKDSLQLTAQIETINAQVRNYRNDIITKSPNSFLSTLLKAMKEPDVPKNDPAAKKDSLFAYHYFKNHYWDGVDLMDDRLARTPFFESRVDKYFEQLVYPSSDSVIKELDMMLSYANASDEMLKFMLLKFVNRYLNQKYMWEDAVFVHLFEKYFAQKNYDWLNDKGRKVVTDRAYSLMANILGTPAAEVTLPDSTGKKISLYGVEAPFVLVTIWDPTCGHCKELVPKLDSMYQAKWKNYGLKLFGLAKETEGTKKDWTGFIQKNQLKDWVHVYDSKEEEQARVAANIPSYAQLYDVQTFPTLYLLDKDKRIIAKKVTFEQVDEILQYKLKNQ
ncbi:MAG TPA: thioredoxin-like domain-containing protein [Flavisolibacter sp.]|jgi:thiol-disulfide isomerase/thioredoxin|nr:thioredoxin-like domain-containing protein [Flavisolibacter sp.]